MGLFKSLLGKEEQPKKDFDLISKQIKSYGNMLLFLGDKEQANEKINEYLAFRQLTEVLDGVPSDQLEKILKMGVNEEQAEMIRTISNNHWKHEQIEKFIDLFQNGKADQDDKYIKIIHERDELGINSITLL